MSLLQACLESAFGDAMARLGPFEPRPALAVAVSGGADSMALIILARNWVRQRDGSARALVVDHGLRPESAAEARITIERLAGLGIEADLLCIDGLTHGPALAERARAKRYEILSAACREGGILHLLLGHHAGDQVETLAMRVLRGSRTHGLAGMPGLLETADLRILRPLLCIEPGRLRGFLDAATVEWIEDPSNRDMHALRSRLRHRLALQPPAEQEMRLATSAVAQLRCREEAEIAAELAHCATIRPEGFAILAPGRIGAGALSALIRAIGGAAYPPAPDVIARLAARIGPATVAGTRIVAAGRFGDGWLIVREEAAVMPPVPAQRETVWDNRFRMVTRRRPFPAAATIGKLGADAATLRRMSDLPSAVLRTLPAIRCGNFLAAVPHLGYGNRSDDVKMTSLFVAPRPVAGPLFGSAS